MNGMSYTRRRFQMPGSDGGSAADCEKVGHTPSGPAKRRVCLRCGVRLVEAGGYIGVVAKDGEPAGAAAIGPEVTREVGENGHVSHSISLRAKA